MSWPEAVVTVALFAFITSIGWAAAWVMVRSCEIEERICSAKTTLRLFQAEQESKR